jgi:hypothetical protein
MTRDQFIETIESFYKHGVEIIRAKNHSYGGHTDPFKNFFVVEALEIASAEDAILVRLSDKFSRLATLISRKKENTVPDESVEDTLLDAANYLAILYALLQKRKQAVQLSDVPSGTPSTDSSLRISVTNGGRAEANTTADYRPDPALPRIPDDEAED